MEKTTSSQTMHTQAGRTTRRGHSVAGALAIALVTALAVLVGAATSHAQTIALSSPTYGNSTTFSPADATPTCTYLVAFTDRTGFRSKSTSATNTVTGATATTFTARYAYGAVSDVEKTSNCGTALSNGNYDKVINSNFTVSFSVTAPGAYRLNITGRHKGSMTRIDDATTGTAGAGSVFVSTPFAATLTENGTAKALTSGSLNVPAPTNLADGTNTLDQPFDQTNSSNVAVVSGVSNGAAVNYVLTTTFGITARSRVAAGGQGDEAAIRGGADAALGDSTAEDYPGQGSRTAANDGMFWTVTLVNLCGDGTIDPALGENCDVVGAGATGSCCGLGCTLRPSTYACRPLSGECDLTAEYCNGTGTSCPADVVKPPGACSDDGNVCTNDVCNGTSSACQHPASNAGTPCPDDNNPCTTDVCDGTNVSCQHPAGNAGAACRVAAGECDAADTCSGTSATCTDVKKPSGTACTPDTNPCSQDICNGTSNTCTYTTAGNAGAACPDDGNPCSLDQCSGTSTTCAHPAGNAGAACPADTNPCTADQCSGTSTTCAHPAGNAGATCRVAAGECDAADTCSGTSTTCTDVKKPSGTACTPDTNACTLDQCNGTSNACTYTSAGNAGATCRAAAGSCDIAETCSGTSTACPADSKRPSTTLCRTAVDECDVADNCNGSSVDCADGKKASGTACTDDGNPCSTDKCDGSNNACQHPAGNKDAACPDDGNPCSLDKCDGTSTTCAHPPGNKGTTCRAQDGVCDVVELCTGSSLTCPTDSVRASGTVCRTASGACDLAETCDGSGKTCSEDGLKSAGTTCRQPAGPCDAAESCDGTTSACPTDRYQAAGFLCRAAAGDCDVDDLCSGDRAACSADVRKPSTTLCRDLQGTCAACNDAGEGEPNCDLQEYCNGGVSCPADLSKPDLDGDALCNEYDNCPGVANSPFLDQDDDGSGDQCDTCTNVEANVIENAYLSIANAQTPQRDDVFVFRGKLVMPAGSEPDPLLHGFRMRFEDSQKTNDFANPDRNTVFDIYVPAGKYNKALRFGWVKAQDNWTFSSKGSIVRKINGINQVIVSKIAPNEYSFAVRADRGSYGLPAIASALGYDSATGIPMKVSVSIDGKAPPPGACAELIFDSATCGANADNSLITCK